MQSFDGGCLRSLPSLTHLDLGNNRLTSISAAALSDGCPLLQTLILSRNEISEAPCPLRLPLLRSLWLNGNRIAELTRWNRSDKREDAMFLPMLQKLFLQDNQIMSLDKHSLECCPMLQELDLSFNALQAVKDVAAALRRVGESLKVVHVQDNPLLTGQVHHSEAGLSLSSSSDDEEPSNPNQTVSRKDLVALQLLRLCPKLEVVCGNEVTTETRLLEQQRRQRKVARRRKVPSISAHSLRGRQFLQLISGLLLQQQCLLSRSKLRSKARATEEEEVDWELRTRRLLEEQAARMAAFAVCESADCEWIVSFGRQEPTPLALATVDADWDSSDGEAATHSLWARDPGASAAVTSVQRLFRGRLVRRKLTSILQSIRYRDEELDQLLLLQVGDDSWMTPGDDAGAMVYGDHIRKRPARQAPSSADRSPRPGRWQDTESYSYGVPQSARSRPSTCMTEHSSSTVQEAAAMAVSDADDFNRHHLLADDWGVSDTKTLSTLAKRNIHKTR
jgi:hypothetical protein